MDESNFPILVQLKQDVAIGHMPFHKDERLIFNKPEEIPPDVPFWICQTQCTPRIEHFFEPDETSPARLTQ